jgi:hypothetical protein
MKLFKTMSLLSLLFYLPLYAEELSIVSELPIIVPDEEIVIEENNNEDTSNLEDLSIEELIEKVKNAPDDQKRVIMNQLKIQLKNMNQESRKKAMIELSESFSQKGVQSQEKQVSGEISIHTSHQPTFRYLQQGIQDGSRLHQGEGQRGQSNNHKGNG